MIIGATKNNRLYIGQLPAIARLINKDPETLRRWNRDNKLIVAENGYIVYLDIEQLK